MDHPYAVVSFVNYIYEDEEVASEVPSGWVSADKKTCYWPKSKNLNTFISKRISPEIGSPQWELHEIKFLGYYDNLEKAREKAASYSSGDEQNVHLEERGNRRKKFESLKCLPESHDESSNESPDESTLRNMKQKKIPSPPDFNIGDILIDNIPITIEQSGDKSAGTPLVGKVIAEYNLNSPATKSDRCAFSDSGSNSNPLNRRPRIVSSQLLQKRTPEIDSILLGMKCNNSSRTTSSTLQSTSNNITSNECLNKSPNKFSNKSSNKSHCNASSATDFHPHPNLDSNAPVLVDGGNVPASTSNISFQHLDFDSGDCDNNTVPVVTLRQLVEQNFEKLFKKMADMVVELKATNDRIKQLQTRSGETSACPNPAFDIIENLIPFHRDTDIVQFEADLAEDIILKSDVILWLKRIGGNGMKDCLIRILKRVFTNRVAKESSWLGQRHNFKVCNLAMMKCIKAAVSAKYTFTDKEFEEVGSEWFRQANQRYVRECSKASKASQNDRS